MFKFTAILSLILLHCFALNAQGFQVIYPGMSGDPLIDLLASNYRPSQVLDYARARDTLYGTIMTRDEDSIRCVYSGHTVYLDPTQDPTQYIYLNGSSLGMNTEHAYPQDKGASEGNARSDMHHLYPARIPVNEARGSLPYADIPDNQTDKWFRGAQTLLSVPAQHIEQYSESNENFFEPRESAKGEIARSIFYFYTVYQAQANAADPNFFQLQLPTLCQWQALDPADSAEMTKTWLIAPYQSGKPNPYVVDCTLASRTWCPQSAPNCPFSATNDGKSRLDIAVGISPNPISDAAVLTLRLPVSGDVEARLTDQLGRELARYQWSGLEAGTHRIPLENFGKSNLTMGYCIVQVNAQQAVAVKAIPVLFSGQ